MKFCRSALTNGKVGLKALVEKLPGKYQFPLERLFYLSIHEPELKLLKRLCRADKVAVDIGANKGIYALFLVDLSSRVVCFEPNPRLADYLQCKFRDAQVRVENCALGNAVGQLELRIPCVEGKRLDGWGSLVADFSEGSWQGNQITKTERFAVEVKRLDDFDLREVGFIKIDVEGFEAAVLAGAMETLKRERPNLLIELEHRLNPHIAATFALLAEMGYAGFFLADGKIHALDDFDLETMQDPAYLDDRKRYINNFIFVPQEAAGLLR